MTVMDILMVIGISALIYTLVGFGYDIIDYCIGRQKKKDREKLDELEDFIRRGYINYNNNMNKQIVYKVDGDFNGDIKGDNVTVILMGDGNLNGNIESNDGNVVLIKGNVKGDIKANKVLMPNKKRDIYTGRRGIVVRCPMCNELYTQSLSINGSTSEDGTNLMLDVKIDVEEPFRHKCESCRYYRDSDFSNRYYWCTEGGMAHLCIKDGATICKYYEGKNDH